MFTPQHAENVYLPDELILTSRFDGNTHFTSSPGSVCFTHAGKSLLFMWAALYYWV